MPIKSCTLPSGKGGFKWGDQGKCYASKKDALKQGYAIDKDKFKKEVSSTNMHLDNSELVYAKELINSKSGKTFSEMIAESLEQQFGE